MGAWSYLYDTAGNLIEQRDARGQTLAFDYDALGRLTARTAVTPTGVYDAFNTKDTNTWVWGAPEVVPFADGGNNVVKSPGNGIDYSAHFYRSTYGLADGEGVQVRFKVDQSNSYAHVSLEANDATYRRFGLVARGAGWTCSMSAGARTLTRRPW